jgi:oligopeptide/dipeptide ABC transporter ATP-binding protein
MPETILEVRDLKKHFPIRGGLLKRTRGFVYAVDGVSISLQRGETLGLVGESGCGKSTLARVILRLIEPTSGEVFFLGKELGRQSDEEMRLLRQEMQIVFQDPFASLNPRSKVSQLVGQSLEIHNLATGAAKDKIVSELLEKVGMRAEDSNRYPHAFSGGQRQRICIARALALSPKLIIADEPVSALDVSIRAQVLNLMENLKSEFDLSLIFISHDLSVIQYISDRVCVMYLGKIVEIAYSSDLYYHPYHPYTKALLAAAPVPDPESRKQRIVLEGDVPSPTNPPAGCRFHMRCCERKDVCKTVEPELKKMDDGHFVACHLV